jgi:predicted DCC family thiol-disulfide oxidoreductase YuxK
MTALPVLLYDGPCTLCQRSVRFILKREQEPRLNFSSLDSDIGKQLQEEYGIPSGVDAVVLIDEAGATWGSDAAFRVCSYLKLPWRLLAGLRHLPSPPFQALYGFIARRREKWFGRTQDCPLPDPAVAERFLT